MAMNRAAGGEAGAGVERGAAGAGAGSAGVERCEPFVCPACPCACDDMTVTIGRAGAATVEPACPVASRWLDDQLRPVAAGCELEGTPCDLNSALERAAVMLRRANRPLIYGLSRSSTDGQRAAVHLAERLGAVVDTTASLCHGPSILAYQNVGESTCTLGEVRNRCDLVIYWGCNPAETHPRHAERYAVFPRGHDVPLGRAGRTVVMVGDAREVGRWRLDPAGSRPDATVELAPGGDFEFLHSLHAIVAGRRTTGRVDPQAAWLAERMTSCRHGVVFFGLGLTGMSIDRPNEQPSAGHAAVESLLSLVTRLNDRVRFYARRMRMLNDVSGADSVLCWQTGYPFGVDFSRGVPRYNPGEFSANELLRRGDVDACLLVGSETVDAFSLESQRRLRDLPVIVLDNPARRPSFTPTVLVTTAVYGWSARGTLYRMDEVPLGVRAHVESPWPTDEDVLDELRERTERERERP